MALCQLFIQPEAAYQSISELGENGTVQFRDVSFFFYGIFVKNLIEIALTIKETLNSSTSMSTTSKGDLSMK